MSYRLMVIVQDDSDTLSGNGWTVIEYDTVVTRSTPEPLYSACHAIANAGRMLYQAGPRDAVAGSNAKPTHSTHHLVPNEWTQTFDAYELAALHTHTVAIAGELIESMVRQHTGVTHATIA